jgi:hypothetical protein
MSEKYAFVLDEVWLQTVLTRLFHQYRPDCFCNILEFYCSYSPLFLNTFYATNHLFFACEMRGIYSIRTKNCAIDTFGCDTSQISSVGFNCRLFKIPSRRDRE